MLKLTRRDGLSEAMWGLFGGAIGLAPQAVESIHDAYLETAPVAITALRLSEIVISFTCFLVGLAILVISQKRSTAADTLVTTIRSRSNV